MFNFKKEREEEKKENKRKKQKKIKKKRKQEKEENKRTREQVLKKEGKERKQFEKQNHKTPKIHWTNCHIMIRKKKTPEGIIWRFFFESSESHPFSINSMIRIRFSGSQELIWKGFSGAR